MKRAQELFELNNRESNKYLVFLTDGEDNYTSFSYDDYINYAIKNGITTYTIGLGNSIDNTLLRKIANTSGGKYFNAEQADDLFTTFSEIKQDTLDYKTDSNNDGISDYYTKRIYDGTLKLGTGVSLKGIDLSKKADYDGDGLLNGEEITIYEYKDRVYIKVLSDPTKVDTDYDGLRDDVDPHRMNSGQTVQYVADDRDNDKQYSYDTLLNLDYRWFFDDNTKFNKDLCNTSLLFAGMAYYRSSSDTSDSSDRDYKIKLENGNKYGIIDAMKYMGLEDVKEYNLNDYYNTEHQSQFNIGHRKVTIDGETKNIVTVFVRGTFGSLNEWSSNFDIGDTRENVSEWTDKSNHKGFDITANRVRERVNRYLNTNVDSSNETVFWVTGHSRGAAISNIIGAKLEDQGKKTFTYTFAAPNTTTKENVKSYKSIFNVVNEDDFTPYVPMKDWEFERYGRTAELDMTSDRQKQFRDNTGFWAYDNESTGGLSKTVNALSEIINNRDECKEYTCSCHGDGSDNSIIKKNYYSFKYLRDNEINLIPDNMKQYCKIEKDDSIDTNFKLTVCQTPMYFMQLLANQMSGEVGLYDFVMSIDVSPKYEYAKKRLILSGAPCIGGLTHPHYVDSYYILSKESRSSLFK